MRLISMDSYLQRQERIRQQGYPVELRPQRRDVVLDGEYFDSRSLTVD